jgi:preprotein translocase subunit SecA
MFGALVRAIFGTSNDRVVRGLRKTVDAINALEAQIAALDNAGRTAASPPSPRLAERQVWVDAALSRNSR